MITKIHFIRHGLTEGNLKHWVYGSIDVPLAPEGIADIEGYKAQGVYPEVPEGAPAFTSCLQRTEDTMRCIYGYMPHEKLEGLNEFNFGKYEGWQFGELIEDPEYIEYEKDKTGKRPYPGGGDSDQSFHDRISEALWHIIDVHAAHWTEDDPDPSSFVFIHGGSLSMVMRILFPHEPIDRWGWVPDPGLGYTVYFDGHGPVRYERIGGESVIGSTGLTPEELAMLRAKRAAESE